MNGPEVEALARPPHPSFWNQLCALWIGAEYRAQTEVAHLSIAEAWPVALKRVHLVVAGEVRWSEAGAGDRAAWVGRGHRQWLRPEMLREEDDRAAHRPAVPGWRPGPRLHGVRERLWWNFYDTVVVSEPGERNAFWAATVGHSTTNLEASGHLVDAFVAFDMYCVPLSAIDDIPWDDLHAEARFHNKLAFEGPLAELVLGMPSTQPRHGTANRLPIVTMPFPWVIPERASVKITIRCQITPPVPVVLRVHLDGLRTRDVT